MNAARSSVFVAIVVALVACARDPMRAPPGAPPSAGIIPSGRATDGLAPQPLDPAVAASGIERRDAPSSPSAVDEAPARGIEEDPSAPVSAAVRIDAPPGSDGIAAGTAAPGPDAAPRLPSVVTALPELCRDACANAHRLVMAELPVDTAKAMREEVQRTLERDCPGRCLQRASLDSARCFVSATSALELAACP